MFEKLEENFDLLEASLLNEKELTKENLEKISIYVKYVQNKLEWLMNEINSLPEVQNKAQELKLLEDIYQEKILYLLEDVTTEMFNLQSFLVSLKEKNEAINSIIEDIDGVEALLMLIPEEIEKNKCLMLAFLN